jgi:hypothetical protein
MKRKGRRGSSNDDLPHYLLQKLKMNSPSQVQASNTREQNRTDCRKIGRTGNVSIG